METKRVKLRSMCMAPRGHVLLNFDLSQAESWIVAFSANEANMKHALMYEDIHTKTAGEALFNVPLRDVTEEQRYIGKRCNHALAYRMSAPRMCEVINKDAADTGVSITQAEAKGYHAAWHRYYSLASWWNDIEVQLANNRTLRNVYGRIRTLFATWGPELFKEATANIPQSTVADHFNGAIQPLPNNEFGPRGGLLAIYEDLQVDDKLIRIVGQAHDSFLCEVLLGDVKEVCERVRVLLHRPILINGEECWIPVDGTVGERWEEMEKISWTN